MCTSADGKEDKRSGEAEHLAPEKPIRVSATPANFRVSTSTLRIPILRSEVRIFTSEFRASYNSFNLFNSINLST